MTRPAKILVSELVTETMKTSLEKQEIELFHNSAFRHGKLLHHFLPIICIKPDTALGQKHQQKGTIFKINRQHSRLQEWWWKEDLFLPDNVVVELVVTGHWNHGTKSYSKRHEHLRSGIKPDLWWGVFKDKDKSPERLKKFGGFFAFITTHINCIPTAS